MLAPLLLLWPMSLGLTWVVAQSIANRPYDRELADIARALAREAAVQVVVDSADAGPLMKLALDGAAAALLRHDDVDSSHFQVLGRRGELLAGDPRLPVPPEKTTEAPDGTVRFRDDLLGDEPVRVAYVRLRPASPHLPPGEALVQVAETLGKRSQLATEIIKDVILPQFLILPLAVLLVWFALARGIRPLAELQQRIRRRASTDLSPIAEGNVPDEVAPLVRAINDLLQRLDRTVATQRQFMADAAHQLKTPLAGLRMQAELAAREIDSGRSDTASLKHTLRQIALSTQRAAHMVNQLLAMARAEDSGQAVRYQMVDVAAIARAVVRDFVPRAFERRIDLGYEGPDTVGTESSTRLSAEPVLLGEMLRNLIDNGLRYTPMGGTVTLRVQAEADELVIQVEDNGPGIAPSEREAVFRPFYRALGTEVDGSGLGLSIVQEVAQRHGGTVAVADARDRALHPQDPGTVFTVTLPRHHHPPDGAGPGA